MGSMSKQGTFLFTSESVGEGHPDKIASVLNHSFCFYRIEHFKANLDQNSDQVSDAVLDACLAVDPLSKVNKHGPKLVFWSI